MEEEFEERIARLERREYADRCAIVSLTAMLAQTADTEAIRESFISWRAGLPEDSESIPGGFEETKELFITLATLASGLGNGK